MKRDGSIASLFQKHIAKKLATSSSSPSPVPAATVVKKQIQEQERIIEEDVNPSLVASTPIPPPTEDVLPPQSPIYDINRLPRDPAERLPIASYPFNDQDAIRRSYILNGPYQPYSHEFKKRAIGGRERGFNCVWFYKYDWVEYSTKKEAGKGTDAFTVKGWNNWNIGEKSLLKHMGSVAHKAAQEKYIGFMNPNAAIDDKIEKWSNEDRRLYMIRLRYSLRCLKFLLHQGLAFRGHNESEDSSNRGNFIELLKFLAANSEEVNKYVLNNAPGNCLLTSPKIQKQLIQCCAIETRKKIIEELGEEPFAILADESSDISHKEQLALCLRYVDKLGRPCEHFLGVVHVDDTTSLSLKEAIEALLASHGLSITRIRGQGYDGASNMKGHIKGLKTLIMQESPSAYYIHCFAHQLQLVLVAVAKGNNDCVCFFDQVSLLLNIVGVSCKRHGMIRNSRLESVMKAIECEELETGSGLNQERGLPRPDDTRWGSHYRTIVNIISMYPTIRDVLITLGEDPTQKGDWPKIIAIVGVFESFDFAFAAHLMLIILGYTNELSECLQRREHDILNAISLVRVAKARMQKLRSNGWDQFLQRVTLFCNKHGVQVPAMDGQYVPYGRSARFARNQTIDDHFRREVFIGVNLELLSCMSAFSPADSFVSFKAQKLRRLADFYPNDFFESHLVKLELQLDNYIDDIRHEDSFKVQTGTHKIYDMVYNLLKLVLLLPVATASVERVFSALTFVKTKLRNKMGDSLLDDLDEDDIINIFMSFRKRRPDKKK
ncbi:hypothetical protein PVAP13_2KG357680 [Panicum virgatum]|uniref:TTF-type domain-containing protein n=1 Tax=Panicum virgatum TaxID=38727 RepID=A0A8T0W522_PANVG|nr:hypothetical protein PVAP13_2KG357680 [Panicum virgatum]